MNLTRESWAIVVLAVLLAIAAVLFARPVLLAGGVLLGSWLLGQQTWFVREVIRTANALEVYQMPEKSSVRVGEEIPFTLAGRLSKPSSLRLTLEAGTPIAAHSGGSVRLEIEPRENEADRTELIRWSIAGRYQFEPATVTATDGRFTESITTGQRPTVTVEPRGPTHIHVGEGGDRFAVASGEHRIGRLGTGLEPADLREYVPGDTTARIDWKATARHATPYVREYEAETHRRTLLVVDHRSPLSMGPTGETKLDYLREVALAVASSTHQLSDPLALLTVGDDGVTERHEPSSSAERYAAIRHSLLELVATTVEPDSSHASNARQGTRATHRHNFSFDSRRAITALEGDDSAFAKTLQPFYADQRTYRTQIASKPLYGALRRQLINGTGAVWVVIFTDDSNLRELHEAVTFARSNGNHVMVVLAPTALFEPAGFSQIERVYDRYRTFEDQRRALARMDRVRALEVAPGDRLSAVLSGTRVREGVR